MTGLLRAEFHRLRARKGVWIACAVGLVLIVLVVGLPLFATAQPPSAQQVAQGQRDYQEAKRYWDESHEADYKACIAEPTNTAAACAEMTREPLPADFAPYTTTLADALTLAGGAGSLFSALIGLIVAATFWGADYRHGTVATWLTFQPSRMRVWASRFIVVALAGAVIATVLTAVAVLLAVGAIFAWQGGAALTNPGPGVGVAARGIGLGAMSACLGGALGVLFRQTLAPILLPLGYFIIAQLLPIVPGYATLVRALPDVNISAYLNNGTSVWVPDPATPKGVEPQLIEQVIPFGQGLAYVLIGTALILAASAYSFSRRDIE